jgi:hypothetical protein
MENTHRPTLVERIRHNLHAIEVIELSGLAVLLSLLFGLVGELYSSEPGRGVGLFLIALGVAMCGAILAVLFLWGVYVVYIRLARAGGSAVDIGLWILMAVITSSITFWCWTILDINRLILVKLFYQGETPVEYAWSLGSKKRRKEWELGRKKATTQRQMADIRAVEPLIAALRDKEVFMREAAAASLGQLGDTRAVEPLIAALKDRQMSVREAAATTLGQLGDIRAVDPLIVALQHNSLDISAYTVVPKIPLRAIAATALGQLGDTRAVEPLIAVLQNKGVALTVSIFMMPVQAAAASALGQLGDSQAIEPLAAALEHKPLTPALQRDYEEVRTAATTALEKLGQKQAAVPAPQEDLVQRLKEFKEMLDAGLITEQEYEAKKADILSKM